jgi:DNA-binding MarR family transcriptional regulator/N-acetylglutamate synthase-like GNAT family acetyltransferase
MGRGRALGACRVLWEVGEAGSDVRALRNRLGLDSGYISRILRSLERDGLVRVSPSKIDGRVRNARLTAKGLKERDELDRESNALASEILCVLGDRQRTELLSAMGAVERILRASMIEIRTEPTHTPDAQVCFRQYFAELSRRFEHGFELGRSIEDELSDYSAPSGALLIARLHGNPVACGALKHQQDGSALVKRLWVSDDVRGQGVGRRMLLALEQHAQSHGAHVVRLDTNKTLTEAITLYRSAGYIEIPAFNNEAVAHHWFEKKLN